MGDLVDRDTEHLRLLSICYYVNAAVTAAFSCLGLFYVGMGALLILMPGTGAEAPPPAVGYIFAVIGLAFVLLGVGFAVCQVYVGGLLKQRRHRTFCLVTAAINCLFVPYGTLLGVFSFMVLMRSSVEELFTAAPPPIPAAPVQ